MKVRILTIFTGLLLSACLPEDGAYLPPLTERSPDGGMDTSDLRDGRDLRLRAFEGSEGSDNAGTPPGIDDMDNGFAPVDGGTPDPVDGGTPDPEDGGTPDPVDGGTPDPEDGGTPDLWEGWSGDLPEPGPGLAHCYRGMAAISYPASGGELGHPVRGYGSIVGCAPEDSEVFPGDTPHTWACYGGSGALEVVGHLRGAITLIDLPLGSKLLTISSVESELADGYALLYRQDEFEAWVRDPTGAGRPDAVYATNNRGNCCSPGEGSCAFDLSEFAGTAPVMVAVSTADTGLVSSRKIISADYAFAF